MRGIRHIPRVSNTVVPSNSIGGNVAGVASLASAAVGIAGGIAQMMLAKKWAKEDRENNKKLALEQQAREEDLWEKQETAEDAARFYAHQADPSAYNATHRQFYGLGLSHGGEVPRYEDGGEASDQTASPEDTVPKPPQEEEYVPSYGGGGNKEDGGIQYEKSGNTTGYAYKNKPWNSWNNINDNILHMPGVSTAIHAGSYALPSLLGLWKPMLGNMINMPISIGAGNPIGAAASLYGITSGFARGENPFREEGAFNGVGSALDLYKNKWKAAPSSLTGMWNIATGLSKLAPIAASWAAPRIYRPTLGLNNTLYNF